MDQNLSEEKKNEKMLRNDWNLSEKQKQKTLKWALERYRIPQEDEKQILVEYRKNYSKMQKLIKTTWFFYW